MIILARDLARGQRARDALASSSRRPADVVQGALDSIPKVRAAAAAIANASTRLDVLIHNAGVWPTRLERDEAGLERAFVVNHLAPFLLNHLLEPLLISARGRVVQVSAGLYVKGRPDLARTPYGSDFSAFGTYATTKLCNLLLVPEFARRWAAHGVTIDAVHPGVIRTDLGDRSGPLGALLRMVKRTWKRREEGARPIVRLACEASVRSGSGRYFELERQVTPAACARDSALAAAVYRQAEALCGLTTGPSCSR